MMVIEAAREVSFTKLIKLFESGGRATRKACGKITRQNVRNFDIPIDIPASHCPCGTELIAALIVSEAYAPVLREKVITPAVKGSNLIPFGKIPLILR